MKRAILLLLLWAGMEWVCGAEEVPWEALSAQRALNRMEASGSSVNIAFLDACRSGLLNSGGGMAPMSAHGTFIGGATGSAKEARAAVGVYTQALLKRLGTPGLSITDMHTRVPADVKRITGGTMQVPFQYSGLDEDVNFSVSVPGKPLGDRGRENSVMAKLMSLGTALAEPHSKVEGGLGAIEGREAGQSMQNGMGTAFRWCPPGEFWMGSSEAEKQSFARWGFSTADETRHRVTLTKGFWLSENETTQEEWAAVMGRSILDQAKRALEDDTEYVKLGNKTVRELHGLNRRDDPMGMVNAEGPSVPVYWVSWKEAVQYCERLTKKERSSGSLPVGWKYALPTEAQWEYACRAGSRTAIYSGELRILGVNNAPALDEIAWYGGNSSKGYRGRGFDTAVWPSKQYPGGIAGIRRVGQKRPNEWGLHDMLGNVDEWCGDWYEKDITGAHTNPMGGKSGVYRVNRGGSWDMVAVCGRAAYRGGGIEPGRRSNSLGFRPALVPSK
jgi:formylglycine-generating enzyme required for sulfatase activity